LVIRAEVGETLPEKGEVVRGEGGGKKESGGREGRVYEMG